MLCDVKDELQIDGGSNDKGEWSQESGCAEKGFMIAPDAPLW